jgi:hypothetical protein
MNPELANKIIDGHIQGIRYLLDDRQRAVTLSRLDLRQIGRVDFKDRFGVLRSGAPTNANLNQNARP